MTDEKECDFEKVSKSIKEKKERLFPFDSDDRMSEFSLK